MDKCLYMHSVHDTHTRTRTHTQNQRRQPRSRGGRARGQGVWAKRRGPGRRGGQRPGGGEKKYEPNYQGSPGGGDATSRTNEKACLSFVPPLSLNRLNPPPHEPHNLPHARNVVTPGLPPRPGPRDGRHLRGDRRRLRASLPARDHGAAGPRRRRVPRRVFRRHDRAGRSGRGGRRGGVAGRGRARGAPGGAPQGGGDLGGGVGQGGVQGREPGQADEGGKAGRGGALRLFLKTKNLDEPQGQQGWGEVEG